MKLSSLVIIVCFAFATPALTQTHSHRHCLLDVRDHLELKYVELEDWRARAWFGAIAGIAIAGLSGIYYLTDMKKFAALALITSIVIEYQSYQCATMGRSYDLLLTESDKKCIERLFATSILSPLIVFTGYHAARDLNKGDRFPGGILVAAVILGTSVLIWVWTRDEAHDAPPTNITTVSEIPRHHDEDMPGFLSRTVHTSSKLAVVATGVLMVFFAKQTWTTRDVPARRFWGVAMGLMGASCLYLPYQLSNAESALQQVADVPLAVNWSLLRPAVAILTSAASAYGAKQVYFEYEDRKLTSILGGASAASLFLMGNGAFDFLLSAASVMRSALPSTTKILYGVVGVAAIASTGALLKGAYNYLGDQCTICLEQRWFSRSLSCGHSFHPNCIFEWFEHNRTCPLCRRVD